MSAQIEHFIGADPWRQDLIQLFLLEKEFLSTEDAAVLTVADFVKKIRFFL